MKPLHNYTMGYKRAPNGTREWKFKEWCLMITNIWEVDAVQQATSRKNKSLKVHKMPLKSWRDHHFFSLRVYKIIQLLPAVSLCTVIGGWGWWERLMRWKQLSKQPEAENAGTMQPEENANLTQNYCVNKNLNQFCK